jgi:hypothetical protein
MAPDVLWVATGRNWPDALTAGATAGPRGDMLVLVDGTTLDNSPPTRDLIASRAGDIRHVNILGGIEAISANVASELRALLDAEASSSAAAAAGAPGSRGPLGSIPLPMTQEVLLLLLAGLLLPAAALFGRRRQARLVA